MNSKKNSCRGNYMRKYGMSIFCSELFLFSSTLKDLFVIIWWPIIWVLNYFFQNSQAARPRSKRTTEMYELYLAEVERETLQHPTIPRMTSYKNNLPPMSSSTYLEMTKDLNHIGYAKLKVWSWSFLAIFQGTRDRTDYKTAFYLEGFKA